VALGVAGLGRRLPALERVLRGRRQRETEEGREKEKPSRWAPYVRCTVSVPRHHIKRVRIYLNLDGTRSQIYELKNSILIT
jgi:hypothetical protein